MLLFVQFLKTLKFNGGSVLAVSPWKPTGSGPYGPAGSHALRPFVDMTEGV